MENNDGVFNEPDGEMSSLPPLNIPHVDLKLARINKHIKVFDALRDKFVTLTPEEYVRQHFVAWLQNTYHYPASLMANEVGIEINDCKRRCDTVIFNPDGSLLAIVEYKSPTVTISQTVFDQIVRYNMKLRAKYLIVSNGINHYCCAIDYENDTYNFIPGIPDYIRLKNNFSEN